MGQLLTYHFTSGFRTHYPLPLLSSPEPDMELMAMTKQEMQTNVTSVEPSSPKCSTPRSTPGMRRIMKRKDRPAAPEKGRSRRISFGKGDFLERVMGEHVEKVLNESFGSGTCNQEKETIASLKLELKEQAREYKREMARLRRDNERLRRRIEEMKIREMEMSADIVRLTERQRLNVPEALSGRGSGRLQRARSASPGQQLRRRHGSASSISLRSYSPRPVRSMFNFFNTDDAVSSRRRGSAERRRSSPAVRQASSELDRRLTAQMRSKSLDDARHSERYLCGPGRRCYREPYHPDYDSGVEANSARRRGDRRADEGEWRTFGDTPRPRSGWRSFDPTQYVENRREALRQRSLERELLSRRPSGRVSRLRPRRKANAARRPSTDQAKPAPAEEAWTEVGDSAVVGMRQLESRLKNLQRMLSEKVN